MNGKYELRRKIGQGSFGSVFLALERRTRKAVVVKQVRATKEQETEGEGIDKRAQKDREALDVQREVQLLSQLSHVNIVEYVESFVSRSNGSYFIVMEYCGGGDLYSKINRQRGRRIPEGLILSYFGQLCRALLYIHERKILHRDIKSQNIFLTCSHQVVKLGDFGIARILAGTHDYARTCVGTPYYLSPEVWENRPYDSKSDLWAMGCVLYEMATLKHAFEAGCMKNLIFKIIRGSYPPISPAYSYDLRNLVSALLRKRPSERPTPQSILRRGFVRRAMAAREVGGGGDGEAVLGRRGGVGGTRRKKQARGKSAGVASKRQGPTVDIRVIIEPAESPAPAPAPAPAPSPPFPPPPPPPSRRPTSASSPTRRASKPVKRTRFFGAAASKAEGKMPSPARVEDKEERRKGRHPSDSSKESRLGEEDGFAKRLEETRSLALERRRRQRTNWARERYQQMRMTKRQREGEEEKAMHVLNEDLTGVVLWIDLDEERNAASPVAPRASPPKHLKRVDSTTYTVERLDAARDQAMRSAAAAGAATGAAATEESIASHRSVAHPAARNGHAAKSRRERSSFSTSSSSTSTAATAGGGPLLTMVKRIMCNTGESTKVVEWTTVGYDESEEDGGSSSDGGGHNDQTEVYVDDDDDDDDDHDSPKADRKEAPCPDVDDTCISSPSPRRVRSLPDLPSRLRPPPPPTSSEEDRTADEVSEIGEEEEAEERQEEEEEGEEDRLLIHGYLEAQRAKLEGVLGLEKLLAVYSMIANNGEAGDDEDDDDCQQVDYSTLCEMLGEENSHLIDDIIQLVVADNFY